MHQVIVIEFRDGCIEIKPYTQLRWKKNVRALLLGEEIVSVCTQHYPNKNAAKWRFFNA